VNRNPIPLPFASRLLLADQTPVRLKVNNELKSLSNRKDSDTKSNRRFWVALNQVDGMDPYVFFRLVERYGSPEQVWNAPEVELLKFGTKNPIVIQKLIDLRKRESGSEELVRAAEAGYTVATLLDPEYPKPLREIPIPPPVIYIRGEWKAGDEKAVAIVGTRECNGYGRRVTEDLAGDLVAKKYTIVSGLAHGIDAVAHRGALQAGGRTVAVKAVGLDVNYPAAHKDLSGEIAAHGAVVSEFPIGTTARDKWQFHRRNRIISGLARGTVVVQAQQKSGSLITAAHAVEQGRQVFAVPGDVLNPLTRGCHWLIKHGAHLVESAEDILEIFGESGGQCDIEFTETQLDGNQKDVHEILKGGPIQFDEICSKLGKPAHEVSSALMMLEMKGHARQLPGKLYEAR
jgi:DNA processing protein